MTDETASRDRINAAFLRARNLARDKERGTLFNALLEMREICCNSPDDIMRLTDFFMEIGERSAALEFFLKNREKIASSAYTELYLAWCGSLHDRSTRKDTLIRLVAEKHNSFDYCLKLSYAAGEVNGLGEAAAAARQALDCATTEAQKTRARFRLAGLYLADKQPDLALAEIRKIPLEPIAQSIKAKKLAVWAFEGGDKQLGLAILNTWLEANRYNPVAALDIATLLAEGGNRPEAAAALQRLFDILGENPALNRTRFTELIETARLIGFQQERHAIDLALRAFPDDEALQLAAEEAARDQRAAFDSQFPPPPDPKPPAQSGLLHRVFGRWRS